MHGLDMRLLLHGHASNKWCCTSFLSSDAVEAALMCAPASGGSKDLCVRKQQKCCSVKSI